MDSQVKNKNKISPWSEFEEANANQKNGSTKTNKGITKNRFFLLFKPTQMKNAIAIAEKH